MSEQTLRRQRRETLTDKMVDALPRRAERYTKADPDQRGMYVRVMPKGSKAPNVYAAVARDPFGKQVWATIGSADVLKIEDAREKAREAIRRIREGKPAFEPPPVKPASYQATAEKWLEVYVAGKGLRSRPEIERLLQRHVFPHWAKRDFVSIGREEINDLLDHLVKTRGAWTADHVLAITRKIANWFATRSSTYRSPFVVGMRRTKEESRTRSRILTDAEFQRVWRAAEDAGTFGALIKVLLLTAQRRGAVVGMKWSDLTPDGVWEIPTEARAKGNAGALKLPEAALAIIKAQPKFKNNKHVFAAARGDGPLNGFNKRKAKFDKACGVPDWVLHDLRRTAKTLMARAGVRPDISERVLGHVIEGVEGVYDQHHYADEKADALRRLAALIERIVNPPSGNVVPLHETAAVS
ncbi:MAG: tyrosine-type recombinase/integrase [Beijerinckiaceae bacterium]|jgi:integrase